jgi:hypothetical protein
LLGSQPPPLAQRAVAGIRANWNRLTTGAVVDLAQSGVPELTALLPLIAADGTLDSMVQEAARAELGR